MSDLVNHPPHYTDHPSGVECIEITRHMNFNLGNAVKYIWRAGLKGERLEDLEKAAWYIADEIARVRAGHEAARARLVRELEAELNATCVGVLTEDGLVTEPPKRRPMPGARILPFRRP